MLIYFEKLNYFFVFNFGPQHPATHGVLRLIVKLKGEYIYEVIPFVGFLHRGTEKLIENRTIIQCLPFFDRFDYVSMMVNEHVYASVIEKLLHIIIPLRSSYIRVIMLELTRILNHLLAVGSCALDLGAMTVLLWFFESREELLGIYESLSGARMHSNYIRPGGVRCDLSYGLLLRLYKFLNNFIFRLDDVEVLLTENRIWKQRLYNVGIISINDAVNLGLSGVLLRSTGFCWDLRKIFPYEIYNKISFDISCGYNGDCMDRYNIRIFEMRQSINIILQCIECMPLGSICNKYYDKNLKLRAFLKGSISSLIKHTKYCFDGSYNIKGDSYISVEAPKGELSVYLQILNSSKPYRCHVRTPGFLNIQSLDLMCKGVSIADIVTIIGTLDIVFGEIDR